MAENNIEKSKLIAWGLNEYIKNEKTGDYKVSNTFTCKKHFGMAGSLEICSFSLDKEDIQYLWNKYKKEDLDIQKIELSKTIEKLNKIKENINFLENN